MDKWHSEISRKSPYILLFGIIWLFWQIFTDELAEIIRSHIHEGGVIMYSITHPYVIMPSLLIILGIYGFIISKRTISQNDNLIQDVKSNLINIDAHERYAAIDKSKQQCPLDTVKQVKKDFVAMYGDIKSFIKALIENVVINRNIDYLISFFKKTADILDKNDYGLKLELSTNELYKQSQTDLAQKRAKLKLSRKKKAIIQENIERICLLTYGVNSSIVFRGIIKSFPEAVENMPIEMMTILESAEAEMRKLLTKMLDDIEVKWKVADLQNKHKALLEKLQEGINNE